jgi:hypothetical protein
MVADCHRPFCWKEASHCRYHLSVPSIPGLAPWMYSNKEQIITNSIEAGITDITDRKHIYLVGGLEHLNYFIPYYVGNVIIPADFNSIIIQSGGEKPPTSYYWYYYHYYYLIPVLMIIPLFIIPL